MILIQGGKVEPSEDFLKRHRLRLDEQALQPSLPTPDPCHSEALLLCVLPIRYFITGLRYHGISIWKSFSDMSVVPVLHGSRFIHLFS